MQTTTTSEPQRSGPGTPPIVGMIVRWDRPTTTGFPPREFATQDIVVTRTDSLFVWCNGNEFGFDRKDWDAGTLAIISSPAPAKQPAPVDAIDWARFIPAAELPETGAKTFHVGEVWAGHDGVYRGTFAINSVDSRGEASVRWHTRYLRERLAHDYEEVLMVDGYVRNARLVRHADGRWADGYGPNGPIDPACRDAAKAKAPAQCMGNGQCSNPSLCNHPATTTTSGNTTVMTGRIVFGQQPAPQSAPWKCADSDCATPTAPRFVVPEKFLLGAKVGDATICVVCTDKAQRKSMDQCDELDARRTIFHERAHRRAMTTPFLPGSAHALAVAGARTWRRPTSYVPLDDPTGGDL